MILQMFRNLFLILLSITIMFSCGKDGSRYYTVSASKMIALTNNDWTKVEKQLKNKRGYHYSPIAGNVSTIIKAAVDLPAVDDSDRAVKGAVLLNVTADNRISFASFDTDPVAQTVAYTMMLHYNRQTLQTLTGISSSIGEIVENRNGSNNTVDVVLSKLNSGQTADQLGMTYYSTRGSFTMVVFRQNNGSYIFSYRSNY